MSIVILILVSLMTTGLFVSNKIGDWKLGRQASETLRMVYSAQRLYLADNPTRPVSSITNAQLIPYLPNGQTSMPTVTALDGRQLPIIVNVSPPVVNGGGGVVYDPSGNPNDGLWDIGP
jgi:hypothetical protein